MYFRKRGAPVVLVALVACLVKQSFAQSTTGEGRTAEHFSTLETPAATEPPCSTDSVRVVSIETETFQKKLWALVRWNVLDSTCRLEHFTLRYKALRTLACTEPLRNTEYITYSRINADYNGQYILVEPYTSYDIGIAAKYTTSGQLRWIEKRIETTPSAPPKLNASVAMETSRQLIFNWDRLTCNNVNGEFMHYRAVLENTDRQPETFLNTTSSVTFRNLVPCTRYILSLSAINRHHEGTSRRVHARTKAKVINATVSTTTVTGSLSVSWAVNHQCPRVSRRYNISYRLIRLKACPRSHHIPQSRSRLHTRTLDSQNIQNSIEITGLEAFARYNVWISIEGVSDSAYTPTLTRATLPVAPLGVRNISYSKTDRHTFSWSAPPCEHRYGNFYSYNYNLIKVSNADIVSSSSIQNIYQTQKDFDLQGCTEYRFEVQVVTLSGMRLSSDWKWIIAETPVQAPGRPMDVSVQLRFRSVSNAAVTWESPNDPVRPCEPKSYYVKHELFYKDMCERASVATVDRNDYGYAVRGMRHNVEGLYAYSKYRVCVRGWNEEGYGLPTCVNFTTGVKAPSEPPERVKCKNKSYDSLTFTWDKPPCGKRNGPISEYEYSLIAHGRNDSRVGYDEGNENGGTVTFTKLIPATTYSFSVKAKNSNLSGDITTVEAITSKANYNPPRHVVVTPLNGTTAAVEWLVPDIVSFNITGYRVEYWQSGLKGNTSITVSYKVVVCRTCPMAGTITGLKPATNHSIQVIAEYKYDERRSRVVEFRTLEEVRATPSRQNAAMTPVLVSIFVIIVVLLLVIAAMLYSRKTDRKIFSSEWFSISFPDIRNAVRRARAAPGKSKQMSNNRSRNHTEREQNGRGLEMEMAGVVSQINNHANQEMESNMSCAIYENMPAQFTKHQAIPVGQLLGYVARRNADGSNSLDEDFKSLPSQKLHSQDIAMKEENKEKNRFINILPYDHSRVKLNMVHGDPHSDYINASFIDGYKSPKKYIAAQGPNTASVDSFWRMVWQYDCRKIVMLTNLREANKKKCEKYWPAERESYGDIWMTMAKEEKNDHYTVRYFNLVNNNTGRDVVQYHYTSWPDMGVPEFSAHLMSFVRITREPLKSHHKGPTIVHCSAGVGRTGTFLTLDAMLDQVQAEQAMDIHSFITSMRQNRPLMVQTKKQYRFIYESLLQDQTCGDTGISRDAFGETYQSLISRTTGMTGIKQQFELLQALTISPHEEETAAARSDDNVGKNRFPDKVPSGRTRPFLMTEVEGGNDYINASFLPGYVSKNQYIGTQTPLPNTVIDFWRLVVDYKVNTIVMLHGNSRDKTYAQYWPTEGSKRYGPYTVDLLKEEYNRPIMHRTLEVTKMDSKKASSKKVKLLQLASCPPQSETPPTLTDVMDLHRALLSALGTTVWKEGDSPLLIHCRDGEGMTGAFCAFLAALDHLDAKQTVDVFHACRKIRTSRPGAVASLAQYQFIYEAVKSFMISSSIYENMAKIV